MDGSRFSGSRSCMKGRFALILASQSPRRIEILELAGFAPAVAPQDVDETPLPGEEPQDLVERLARLKAASAAFDAPRGETVIAADTIVWLDGIELGKPADAADAARMLRLLSGRTHHVSTGVAIARGEQLRSFVETTAVTFFELTDAEIDAYVATGDPLDKAGAYGYQSQGCTLVRGIEGDFFNVVGLPIARLVRELAALDHEEDR